MFSLYLFSRVMDSKWGGKTETINMKLNVEQVWENCNIIKNQFTSLSVSKACNLPYSPAMLT